MVVKGESQTIKTIIRCTSACFHMVVKDDRKEFSKIDC